MNVQMPEPTVAYSTAPFPARLACAACCWLLSACPGSDTLSCDPDAGKQCPACYACRIDRCVPLPDCGHQYPTCSDQAPCPAGLVCPPNVFSCLPACTQYFAADPACDAATLFCTPIYNADGTSLLFGACLTAECSVASPCDYDRVCLLIGSVAGVCQDRCQYLISGGTYTDNALGDCCHPMGAAQDLIVWRCGARTEGEACDPFTAPCAKGLACIAPAGVLACHRLCDPALDAGSDGCTSAHPACVATTTFGYCRD